MTDLFVQCFTCNFLKPKQIAIQRLICYRQMCLNTGDIPLREDTTLVFGNVRSFQPIGPI